MQNRRVGDERSRKGKIDLHQRKNSPQERNQRTPQESRAHGKSKRSSSAGKHHRKTQKLTQIQKQKHQ